MNTVKDKTALVTGASSGIGEVTARAFAEAGMKVALAARREDRLQALAGELGSGALALPMDVTNKDNVLAGVDTILNEWGHINILVNNAGLMPLSFIRNLHLDEWDRMVDVNIKGVLYVTAAVLPHMLERKSGHIVNVSSLAGRRVFPSGSVYCGTKFFVNAFSDGLRMELSPKDNIRVTVIEPARTKSELTQHITDESVKEFFAAGKDWRILDAEDIANAIVYAVSQPPHVNVNEILIRPTEQDT